MSGYNQYIGMRYVPIIDGEWSQSKAYEPLVVVTYNGNSYISKTYVPAGTLPTNETYWILAANYNAQVEQYRQEVREYQGIVGGFSDDITSLKGSVTGLDDMFGHVYNVIGFYSFTLQTATGIAADAFEDVTGTIYDMSANSKIRYWRAKYPDGTLRMIPTGFFSSYGTLDAAVIDIQESGTIAGGDYSCSVTPSARIRNVSDGTHTIQCKLQCLLQFIE